MIFSEIAEAVILLFGGEILGIIGIGITLYFFIRAIKACWEG